MSGAFGSSYAAAYDALYADKDYAGECALIQRIAEERLTGARSILDLGCGTGGHAVRLAGLGYRVTGVDRSPAMIALARQKAVPGTRFEEGEIGHLALGRRFDLVLMMFSVLGYQLTDGDVARALGAAHAHTRPGGLLLFDVWYGPAVLRQGPSSRCKEMPSPSGKLIRHATGRLQTAGNICTVDYRLERQSAGGETEVFEETHRMRYFFADELRDFVRQAGFTAFDLRRFPDHELPADQTCWNALGMAQSG